jgi:hypothetical protein
MRHVLDEALASAVPIVIASGFGLLGPIQIKIADGRGLPLLHCDTCIRFVIKIW